MKEIVNVSKTWGIGKDGDLLVTLPPDMKFFRETTAGAVCIMGSTTLDSFPGMAPLKNRVNIVMIDDERKIHQEALDAAAADKAAGKTTELIYVHSLEEAMELGKSYEAAGREVFVIGGATIYRICLPYCDEALITINDSEREADTFFPNLEASDEWEMCEEGEELSYEAPDGSVINYRFTKWVRR